MPVLVVVDMQPYFDAAQDQKTLENVLRLIREAREADNPIVILEFGGCGPSHREIYDAIEGYVKVAMKTKYENDGASEVFEACIENDWQFREFILCGVNTGACVKDTIFGLYQHSREVDVTVVANACNQPYSWGTPWIENPKEFVDTWWGPVPQTVNVV